MHLTLDCIVKVNGYNCANDVLAVDKHGYVLRVDENAAHVYIKSMDYDGWFPKSTLEVIE